MSNATTGTKSPFVERLPCKLSREERDLKADELAHAVHNRDALTLEKSLAAQKYAKELKATGRKIGDLAEEVRNGVEYREIRVTERKDFNRNVIEIIRMDTHEVCGQRAMRGEERQAEIKYPNGKPADDRQLPLGAAEEVGPDDEEEEGDDLDDDEIEESAELDAH